MQSNLKRKKKGKVLFSFRKKIEMESETFKWRKMTGIPEPSQRETEGGFLEKENSVIK